MPRRIASSLPSWQRCAGACAARGKELLGGAAWNSATVDLIYADPPFNSNQNYGNNVVG